MGVKGLVGMVRDGVLLNEGIGDTIRVSLTRVRAATAKRCTRLRAAAGLEPARFSPSVTACPGCGRTTSSTFQERRAHSGLREQMPGGRRYEGVETMTLAVMDAGQRSGRIKGGEYRHQPARYRRSAQLPGLHRRPACRTLRGNYDELAAEFRRLVDDTWNTRAKVKS